MTPLGTASDDGGLSRLEGAQIGVQTHLFPEELFRKSL
jgi:hypothetical protein